VTEPVRGSVAGARPEAPLLSPSFLVREFALGRNPADPGVRWATWIPGEYMDGDTFTCDVDFGFRGYQLRGRMLCRLAGMNAPDAGEGGRAEATAELARVLGLGDPTVIVEAMHADKFSGRFDAVVVVSPPGQPPIVVNEWMVGHGLAVPWDGRGKRPVVPWPPPGR
jgi:endonuclease YncB( thermonuclease family)